MMTVATGASYGYPPLSMQDMTAGQTVGLHPMAHPATKIGFGVYAVALLVVAGLYFWKGR